MIEARGTFHVWGHSWEIAALGLWDELEQLFRLIAERRSCVRLVGNAELAQHIRTRGQSR